MYHINAPCTPFTFANLLIHLFFPRIPTYHVLEVYQALLYVQGICPESSPAPFCYEKTRQQVYEIYEASSYQTPSLLAPRS